MRLRSQDKTVDVPYELSTVQLKKTDRDEGEVFLIKAVMSGETFKLGTIHDKAKGLKVLDEIAARAQRDEKYYNIPAENDI